MSAMHKMLEGLNPAARKNETRDRLLANAEGLGVVLSRSRADRLAGRYKQGRLDHLVEELQQVIDYADPTGETAVRRVLAAA